MSGLTKHCYFNLPVPILVENENIKCLLSDVLLDGRFHIPKNLNCILSIT